VCTQQRYSYIKTTLWFQCKRPNVAVAVAVAVTVAVAVAVAVAVVAVAVAIAVIAAVIGFIIETH
jgi:hypothetical protein